MKIITEERTRKCDAKIQQNQERIKSSTLLVQTQAQRNAQRKKIMN